MRHAAITLADQVTQLVQAGGKWNLVYCSDMLNLGEFRGLMPASVRDLPSVAYFHENQLTYPVRVGHERDYHFVISNMVTALSATRVWFNSAFHRDTFLGDLPGFLKKMPDHQPFDVVDRIRKKSEIVPLGVESIPARPPREPGPIRILWAARWEHDKNPEAFFLALKSLKLKGVEFRISVIGEQFRERPPIFDWARQYFYHHIDRWGYQETRADYEQALAEADVMVSTANHEFFGITAVEAIAAGAYPVLPRRLAYLEVLAADGEADTDQFFYDNEPDGLADRLTALSDLLGKGDIWDGDAEKAKRLVSRYFWPNLIPMIDGLLDRVQSTS